MQPECADTTNLARVTGEFMHGATIARLLKPGQMTGVGVDHVAIEPRTALALHVHDVSETLLVIQSGAATVHVGGHERRIVPGDVIYIDKGVTHGIWTSEERVTFLSIQCPAIYPEGGKADVRFE